MLHNFKQLDIKAAEACHPIIHKEVDELLAKGAIEPSSGSTVSYSSVFVVPKCTGGVWHLLNLKQYNNYMQIPTLRMPTVRPVWQLIQCGDYAFTNNLKDAKLHIHIIKHHCDLFGKICNISGKFYFLGWPWPLVFSLSSLNPLCSFAESKVSVFYQFR